jgi:hypothetical protein
MSERPIEPPWRIQSPNESCGPFAESVRSSFAQLSTSRANGSTRAIPAVAQAAVYTKFVDFDVELATGH